VRALDARGVYRVRVGNTVVMSSTPATVAHLATLQCMLMRSVWPRGGAAGIATARNTLIVGNHIARLH